ncbi:hypothetical protein ACFFKU_01770 [Kineococcus gynurae]|uniref:Uncharacterized protein n=1 Tax=Kineococcus gynurae TaxID=452979 RepID=A0ABV5LSW4_9ACTN
MSESHEHESDTLTIPRIRADRPVAAVADQDACEPDCFFCLCPETD